MFDHHFEIAKVVFRCVVGLGEDDIQKSLEQHNLNYVTYEIPPGIRTIKDFSQSVCRRRDHEETLRIQYDGISMKTKLFSTRFG